MVCYELWVWYEIRVEAGTYKAIDILEHLRISIEILFIVDTSTIFY